MNWFKKESPKNWAICFAIEFLLLVAAVYFDLFWGTVMTLIICCILSLVGLAISGFSDR